MRVLFLLLILTVAVSGCGKKKEKTDIIADLETKPVVTEVAPSSKAPEPEPQIIDNSQAPKPESIPEVQEGQSPAGTVPTDTTDAQSQGLSPQGTVPSTPSQGYEMTATKVDPNAPPPAAPQAPAPYPPYQGYQTQPPPQPGAYQNPYGAPPPSPYGYGYPPPPPKKYVPPGPIESAGEFIGHLVNPFKRKEDESKKEYKGI